MVGFHHIFEHDISQPLIPSLKKKKSRLRKLIWRVCQNLGSNADLFVSKTSVSLNKVERTSLEVSGFHTPNVGGTGSIPDERIKISHAHVVGPK